MPQKKFIRLNINDNYLSFGNVFRIIKEETNTTNMFLQADLFSIIFNTYNIADSTVNNYCTGLRAINPKYRNYFKELKNKFNQDKNVLILTALTFMAPVRLMPSKGWNCPPVTNF